MIKTKRKDIIYLHRCLTNDTLALFESLANVLKIDYFFKVFSKDL